MVSFSYPMCVGLSYAAKMRGDRGTAGLYRDMADVLLSETRARAYLRAMETEESAAEFVSAMRWRFGIS